MHGQVKWFDPAKGFGFVVSDQSQSDIFLHANVLRKFGQGSIADGSGITVKVRQTLRGLEAVEVLAIEPPAGSTFALSEDTALATPAKIAALPMEPGRVKWFDKGKGFGFANVFGRHEDVVIHVEVLRQSGCADLQAGKARGLGRVAGKQGRRAVQGVSWETAVRRGS